MFFLHFFNILFGNIDFFHYLCAVKSFNDILSPISTEWKNYNAAFEQCVKQEDNELLEQIWHYISSRRGKQLRPMLVLLSAALSRQITDKTMDTAIAMELLHTASLVHDDVVDCSPMRRGQASVQDRWTNKIAVLTGDYLLSRVICQTAKIRNYPILQIVSDLGAGLANGELLQLHHNQSMWLTREQYYHVIEQKTAILFRACTEAGAISAGATYRAVTAMRHYGLNLGICFQIQDDILDWEPTSELGKPAMADIRDGKATLPLIIALERADRQEADEIRALCESDAIHDAHNLELLSDFILRYNGIGAARKVADEYCQQAIEALQFFRPSAFRDSLTQIATMALNRTK